MKIKTIQKILQSKFNEFCESIEDEKVRKLVHGNSIITGGAIASILLKEQINDFDLYFTNKETVKAVAQYYVDKFIASPAEHKHKSGVGIEIKVVDCDDESVKHGGSGSAKEEGRIKIYIKSAGIAGEKGEDNYQYFESLPQQEADDYINEIVDASEEIKNETAFDAKPKYRPVFISANAITLSNKIQVVIRFYGAPEQIHLHYDYIYCTNYWLSSDGKLYLNQPALEALLSKELVYVGSKYPLCSIIRTRKFVRRGWKINAGQYLKMCYQLSLLNLCDINVLEDQLTGVDAAYFGQLINGLRSHETKQKEAGNDFKLEYGYLATIIDKIF